MEHIWFLLRDDSTCEHLPLDRIRYLKADRNYTHVHYLDGKGEKKSSLQSGNIGKFKHILKHGFVELHRSIIVNRSKVIRHGAGRTVTIDSGETFRIPKDKWKKVKELLSRQLIIPFGKKDDSLNETDAPSTQ